MCNLIGNTPFYGMYITYNIISVECVYLLINPHTDNDLWCGPEPTLCKILNIHKCCIYRVVKKIYDPSNMFLCKTSSLFRSRYKSVKTDGNEMCSGYLYK